MSSPLPSPSGLIAIVKRECPTCTLVVPVLTELAKSAGLTIYSQDDPGFPPGVAVEDDRSLRVSLRHQIESVPTLLRFEDGNETGRSVGWHRHEWQELTSVGDLGPGLPDFRPG